MDTDLGLDGGDVGATGTEDANSAGEGTGESAGDAAASNGGQAPGPGPWASDLERFPEEVRGDLDSYLRETWQPRVTQLEQSQMPEGVGAFLEDIQNPETADNAFLQMAYELYGEDAIPFFETALQYAYGDQGQGVEPGTMVDPNQQGAEDDLGFDIELDPEDRQALDFIREQQEDAAFDGALHQLFDAYGEDFPSEDFDTNKLAISPFVYAADGDLAQGFELYREWADAMESTGMSAEQAGDLAAAGVEPAEITPQTLGQAGQTPGAPVLKQGQDLGDAIEEMLGDMRATSGPPSLG